MCRTMSQPDRRRVRVSIDQSLCVCSLACAETVPFVFKVEGHEMTVIHPEPPAELTEAVAEAEFMCPTGAIQVVAIEE